MYAHPVFSSAKKLVCKEHKIDFKEKRSKCTEKLETQTTMKHKRRTNSFVDAKGRWKSVYREEIFKFSNFHKNTREIRERWKRAPLEMKEKLDRGSIVIRATRLR